MSQYSDLPDGASVVSAPQATPPAQPEAQQYSDLPQGATVMSPPQQAPRSVAQHAGEALGAVSESYGLPSSISEIKPYMQRSAEAAHHPIESLKQIGASTAKMLGQPNDPELLDKAKASWEAGDKTSAAVHFMNYLTPFVGSASDRAGLELAHGDYGKAIGHTVAAILPFLFGTPAEAAARTEAEAGNLALKQGVNNMTAAEQAAREGTSRIGLETKTTSQGAQIPVKSTTLLGKAAQQAVSPETLKDIAQEHTAPAVKQAVGDVVGKAAGSTAETVLNPEKGDSFGLGGHRANLEAQSKPVFDRIDELSGGKLSDAKEKVNTANGDHAQYVEGKKEQQALYDQYREQLAGEGMDVDNADRQYRRSIQVEKMRASFERSVNPDTGELSGKRLSAEIGKLVQKGGKGAIERGDFTPEHVAAMREVADIMKQQEKLPAPFVSAALHLGAGLFGLEHFGSFLGGFATEHFAEPIARGIADRLFADALAEPSAASRLPEALRTGNTAPIVSALQKSDPTWIDRTKDFVKNVLIKGTRGEAGMPGSVFEDQLRAGGMTDADIAALNAHESAPVEGETENNASGGNATSLEAVRRLAGQQGEQHFRVDSRMANSPDAWKPIPATVDRVDMHPGPNEHFVTMKDGEITNTESGENARPLPTNEQIKKMVSNTSVLTRDGANALLNKLNVEGLKAVGSVATGGKSLHDLDLLAPSKESAAEAREKLEAQGFEWMGSGGVSPKEAARYGEGKPYGDKDLWSVADKYEHKDTGEKLEVWHKEPGEKTTADLLASPEHRATLGQHEVGTRLGVRTVNGEKTFAPNDTEALSGLNALDLANKRGDEAGNGSMSVKQKLVAAFNDYDNTGLTFTPAELKSPNDAIAKIVDHLKENNKWLYDQIPEVIKQQAQKWYDFAHQTTYEKAQEAGLSHPQVAGAYAVLSPQNAWHNNKMVADRLIDLYTKERTHDWSSAMDTKLSELRNKETSTPEFKAIADALRGKKFDQLAGLAQGDRAAQLGLEALWLRVLDEAESKDRQIKVYGPDGNIINHDGGRMAWPSLNMMSKALDIIKNGKDNLELISQHLGEGNKVRNFYNNIINPWSDRGHFTADTHQVGAALMQPVSSQSPAVAHNFGSSAAGYKGSSPGKNGPAGVKGTYPVYHEAGVQASNEVGVQYPRQFQSITWEGIRSLMGDEKTTPELKKAVDIIWKRHREGDMTLDEARTKIMHASGGFTKPEWMSQEDWDADTSPNKAENILANRKPENEPKQIIAAEEARQMGVKNQKALDAKVKKTTVAAKPKGKK